MSDNETITEEEAKQAIEANGFVAFNIVEIETGIAYLVEG